MKTVILANGIIRDYAATKQAAADAAHIIACDGGLRHAHAMGMTPDAIIGDMDSVPPDLLESTKRSGTKTIIYPTMKDETDLELAMIHAHALGATSIKILGALGGRIDHALANMHLLAMYPQITEIWDEETSIQLIVSSLTLPKSDYVTLSLIPLTTEVTGITTHGLIYPLRGETLKVGSSRGISNCFSEDAAIVTIDTGLLLAIRVK